MRSSPDGARGDEGGGYCHGRGMLKRILIVDDHAGVRLALTRVIESVDDFEVCGKAENGRVGVERALRLKPDLIILDLSMPVMDGLEAARELNELMPAVPILMYTSLPRKYLLRRPGSLSASRTSFNELCLWASS
jgi:DNA-binding NarL/FixJ family response regulator